MRLLNVSTLEIEEVHGAEKPPYAILSHTWGEEELSLSDMVEIHTQRQSPERESTRLHELTRKRGFDKIIRTCKQAQFDGYSYVWVDTCCIDKSSSSELSEAINSMFAWYREAGVCYAFLEDVEYVGQRHDGTWGVEQVQFRKSRWFTRGWTLQELLAPRRVIFFGKDKLGDRFRRIGARSELAPLIKEATGIDQLTLLNPKAIQNTSIARRMSWAAKRQTTRPEDRAYSLLGIFGVNMPLLYGEGGNAFIRLQEEIMKNLEDQTILSWDISGESWLLGYDELVKTDIEAFATDTLGVLATSPDNFAGFGNILSVPSDDDDAFMMTNRGLNIRLRLIHLPARHPTKVFKKHYLAVLSCRNMDEEKRSNRVGVLLRETALPKVYVRAAAVVVVDVPDKMAEEAEPQMIYIPKAPPQEPRYGFADGRVFVRASDILAPGYTVSGVVGLDAQWNSSTFTLNVAVKVDAGLRQLAILMLYNRYLETGFLVQLFYDYSSEECAAEVLTSPPDPEDHATIAIKHLEDLTRVTWERYGGGGALYRKPSMLAVSMRRNPQKLGPLSSKGGIYQWGSPIVGPEGRAQIQLLEKWEVDYVRLISVRAVWEDAVVLEVDSTMCRVPPGTDLGGWTVAQAMDVVNLDQLMRNGVKQGL